eukprot:TRINITY_DN847_c0_g2_i2.p1 TRINITY_DN847_c0_g2~~TRINITY_DN847_c0_g2_i2.p1  ORF type:complete len:658 (+),score=316.40 TRINITY_DN847_c0_g2_i2:150-1976(+)
MATEEKKKLQQLLDDEASERRAFTKKLHERTIAMDKLAKDVEVERKSKEKLRAELEEVKSKNKHLHAEVDGLKSQEQKLRDEVTEALKQLEEIRESRKNVDGQAEEAAKTIKSLEEKLESITTELKKSGDSRKAIDAEHKKAAEEVKVLKGEVERAKKEVESVTDKLKKEVEELERQLKEKDQLLSAAQLDVASQKEEKENLELELVRVRDSEKELQERLLGLQKESGQAEELQKLLEQEKEKAAALARESRRLIEEGETKLASAAAEAEEAKGARDRAEEERGRLEEEVKMLTEKWQKQEQGRVEAELQAEKAAKDLKSMVEVREAAAVEVNNLKTETERLKAEIAKFREGEQQQLVGLQEENGRLVAEISALSASLLEKEQAAEQAKAEREKLQGQLSDLGKAMKGGEIQVAEVEKENSRLLEEVRKQREEAENLASVLAERNLDMKKLEGEVATFRTGGAAAAAEKEEGGEAAVDDAGKELKKLKTQLEAKEKEILLLQREMSKKEGDARNFAQRLALVTEELTRERQDKEELLEAGSSLATRNRSMDSTIMQAAADAERLRMEHESLKARLERSTWSVVAFSTATAAATFLTMRLLNGPSLRRS